MSETSGEPAPDTWPHYNIGSRDHLHAVGVLVASWTEVEQTYKCLFQFTFAEQIGLALRTFELLGNDGRAALIREECVKLAQPQFEEHLLHFLKCAAICKENRNAVAHAHFLPSEEPEFAILDRGRDRVAGKLKLYRFSVTTIRDMADETYAVANYGQQLWALMEVARTASRGSLVPPHFAAAAQIPLIGKPPQPRKWDLRSQERTEGVQRQQPPSHE